MYCPKPAAATSTEKMTNEKERSDSGNLADAARRVATAPSKGTSMLGIADSAASVGPGTITSRGKRVLRHKTIADTPDRLKTGRVTDTRELLAQVLHVYVEDIAPGERIEVPHLIAQVFPLQHLVGTAEKTFEERILFERERYLLLSFEKTPGGTIYSEFAHGVHDQLCDGRPSQDGTDASDELFR